MTPDASKLVWLIVNPANILTFLLLIGAFFLLFGRMQRLGRLIVLFCALFAGLVSFTPLSDWMLSSLESRFDRPHRLPDNVAGIIVLGGAIDTQQSRRYSTISINGRSERIISFVELAKRFPAAKLVYTGGSGDLANEEESEAAMAAKLLVSLGVPAERLTLEMRSRDTYENATMSLLLLKPRSEEAWLLVTSAAHMPRAMGTFRRSGWSVIAYPVDRRSFGSSEDTFGRNLAHGLGLLNLAVREWVSLAHYYVTARTSEMFPAP